MKLRTDLGNAIVEACGVMGGCVSLLVDEQMPHSQARALRQGEFFAGLMDRFADGEVTQADGRKILATFLREMLATLEGKPC